MLLVALAGAAMGAGALLFAYTRAPGLVFEMDKPVPSFVQGLYANERDDQGTFAWTSGQVRVGIPTLDRSGNWTCTLRFRGARPVGEAPPIVDVRVDDARVAALAAAPEYHDLGFALPASDRRGVSIDLLISSTFTPGTADTRVLGVQVDRLACRPAGMVWPPAWPTMLAAASVGVLTLFLSLSLMPLSSALALAAAAAAGVGAMLTTGGAIYSAYATDVLRLSVWIGLAAAILIAALDRIAGRRITAAARVAIGISAVALFLKVLGLWHPAKPIIDAVFHAHRLEAVMAGKYFFSQPFVGGVQMPYAIGLYVFAWPWAWLSTDHVAVIRTVTATADVIAAGLLYPVVARAWDDRRAAVLAVLAFQLTPLPFGVLGNANLANIFGQSVALVTMAAAVTWRLEPRRLVTLTGFTLILTWAFCSHVSTVTTLSATLGLLVLLYAWRGDAARRRAAASIVIAAAAAIAIAWFVFYQHFLDEFTAAFARMFSTAATAQATLNAAELAKGYMTRSERVVDVLAQAVANAGWPLIVLSAIGAWRLWRRGLRDRLTSALMAWAIVWVVFSASTVISKVGPEYRALCRGIPWAHQSRDDSDVGDPGGLRCRSGLGYRDASVSAPPAPTRRRRAHRRRGRPRGARMAAVV